MSSNSFYRKLSYCVHIPDNAALEKIKYTGRNGAVNIITGQCNACNRFISLSPLGRLSKHGSAPGSLWCLNGKPTPSRLEIPCFYCETKNIVNSYHDQSREIFFGVINKHRDCPGNKHKFAYSYITRKVTYYNLLGIQL